MLSYAQTPADSSQNRPDTSKLPVDTVKKQTDTVKAPIADTTKPITDSTQNIPVIKPPANTTDSLNANTNADSTANDAAMGNAPPAPVSEEPQEEGIGKLEDCEIPFTMAYQIKNMTYKELDSLRIEFQKIVKEEEEEKIITIKMRYTNEHIIGYMTQAPIHHSNKYIVINLPINVKIGWCCVPDSTHPSQHCATTRAELIGIDTTEHCKRWKQQDDGTDMLDQLVANKRKIDLSKYKKKRKFNPLAFLNVFKRKKKKEMIGIPMDKTLPEILKSGEKSPGSS
ncbi:hypothetical protein [Filimonas lacunae]|nr:hypothetical protein [Filimonas lacunae]BAV09197.1 hypothetical protein FLA_5245 [Filimonas lacunae]